MPPETEALLRDTTLWDMAVILAAIGGLVGIVVVWAKVAHPIYRAYADFHRSWFGAPEERDAAGNVTRPAQSGILHRLDHHTEQLDELHRGQSQHVERLDQVQELLTDAMRMIAYHDQQLVEHHGAPPAPARPSATPRR